MKITSIRFLFISLTFLFATITGFAESRSERKARIAAESAQPTSLSPVSSGMKFVIEKPFSDAFQVAVRALVENGYTIESANKETFSIITSLSITGGYRQTGTRAIFTVLDDGGKTTVAVLVTTQKRYKALQVEPWSEPSVERTLTEQLCSDLKATTSKLPWTARSVSERG